MWPFRRKWQPSLAKEQARRKAEAAQNDVRLQDTLAHVYERPNRRDRYVVGFDLECWEGTRGCRKLYHEHPRGRVDCEPGGEP